MRLLLLLGLLQIGCVLHRGLTREEVLQRLAPRFPLEAKKSLFYARLQNPDLSFPGADKLQLKMEAEVGAPGFKRTGFAVVQGKVDFHSGGIYLKDASVLELDLGLELPPEWKPHVELAVETAILTTLEEKPIYEINDGRVKKVWVERDRLMLEIRP
jgi:hypothetical protein